MVTVDKQAAVPTSMELTCNLITFFVFFPFDVAVAQLV